MIGNAAVVALCFILTNSVVTGYPAKDIAKKCLRLDEKVEQEIDYVVDRLTEYLNTLGQELEEIDLTVINLEINQHRDDEQERDAILQLTVNNCPRKTIENENADDTGTVGQENDAGDKEEYKEITEEYNDSVQKKIEQESHKEDDTGKGTEENKETESNNKEIVKEDNESEAKTIGREGIEVEGNKEGEREEVEEDTESEYEEKDLGGTAVDGEGEELVQSNEEEDSAVHSKTEVNAEEREDEQDNEEVDDTKEEEDREDTNTDIDSEEQDKEADVTETYAENPETDLNDTNNGDVEPSDKRELHENETVYGHKDIDNIDSGSEVNPNVGQDNSNEEEEREDTNADIDSEEQDKEADVIEKYAENPDTDLDNTNHGDFETNDKRELPENETVYSHKDIDDIDSGSEVNPNGGQDSENGVVKVYINMNNEKHDNSEHLNDEDKETLKKEPNSPETMPEDKAALDTDNIPNLDNEKSSNDGNTAPVNNDDENDTKIAGIDNHSIINKKNNLEDDKNVPDSNAKEPTNDNLLKTEENNEKATNKPDVIKDLEQDNTSTGDAIESNNEGFNPLKDLILNDQTKTENQEKESNNNSEAVKPKDTKPVDAIRTKHQEDDKNNVGPNNSETQAQKEGIKGHDNNEKLKPLQESNSEENTIQFNSNKPKEDYITKPDTDISKTNVINDINNSSTGAISNSDKNEELKQIVSTDGPKTAKIKENLDIVDNVERKEIIVPERDLVNNNNQIKTNDNKLKPSNVDFKENNEYKHNPERNPEYIYKNDVSELNNLKKDEINTGNGSRPQFNKELNEKPDTKKHNSNFDTEPKIKSDPKSILNAETIKEKPNDTNITELTTKAEEKHILNPQKEETKNLTSNILRNPKDSITNKLFRGAGKTNEDAIQKAEKNNVDTKKDLLGNERLGKENINLKTSNSKPELVFLHLSDESEKIFRQQGKEPVVLYMYDLDKQGTKKKISFVNQ